MEEKRSWNFKNPKILKCKSKQPIFSDPITYSNPLYSSHPTESFAGGFHNSSPESQPTQMTGLVMVTSGGSGGCKEGKKSSEEEQNQLSLVDFLLAAVRKSMVACRVERGEEVISAVNNMEIGWPTNVRHVTHVTFDRFNGFLGLPVEFEVDVPGRVPSASASVFGVSAESMQLSFDSKGNSVPTILLLMQERLYSQGGLKAEGIFRINPENSKEEFVRNQLNRGIVPDDIDVHCLAGLIKAWFRELPSGVLDGLSPEEVLQCNTEEESFELVKQLKPTEAALLNWAISLMADVVEEEEFNKMNARNIAMVFAPNMTQMSDPLTALMHAVQVMNLLKTLIMKTLREREETDETGGYSPMSSCLSDHQSDEDLYSHPDMDTNGDLYSHPDMDTNSELRGLTSDYDENAHYSNSSEDEDEVRPLSDIEECFLRRLDEKKTAPNSMAMLNKPTSKSLGEYPSPQSCSSFNMESGTSSVDSKNGNSGLCASYGEDSGKCTDMESPSVSCSTLKEMDMEDRVMESVSTRPLFAST
ncbi:putative Rho GTPase activation protein [Rosa chinensis]|uniref:Putative Rho GTPase activation protein n=1 Tax=Rosa chinensis TaxID=74649 RepID=A0A2P6PWD2_ROSCH|nr:rho GTPase-activating protein 2 [Rosa chinensis]PRQ26241.1 putative Rho GTPase activation protein [Rosa chinensis]